MSDAELAAGLGAALGRPVAIDGREMWPARSSAPMEALRVDGVPMLFKDLTPDPGRARPAFVVDPLREIAVYRDVLGPAGIDAPAFCGAVIDAGRTWLFLERLDAVPLDQAPAFAAWEAAARWLARLHARPLPAVREHLLTYDAAWLGRWLPRARTHAGGAAVAGLERPVARAIEHLASWPRALMHGEFYPANVLVRGSRSLAVDWETAGVGPGLLDLAALTSGDWDADERCRVERAYRLALPAGRRPSAAALALALRHCRLLLAVQWVGWDERFSAPLEHTRDWLADAHRLAAELAP